MFLKPLANQLIRDMQASLAKTAVLGLLFLVGLYFWAPPLYRALTSSRPAAPAATAPAASPAPRNPAPAVQAEKSFARSALASPSGEAGRRNWRTAEQVLATDPLVRSAEVAAIQSDPFRINTDQFPPPLLFANEPAPPKLPEPTKTAPAASPETESLPADLVLKSTIVGVTRRAALINQRLYREGAIVRAGGENFELVAVHPRKVVLRQGEKTFELKLPDYTTGDGGLDFFSDELR